MALHESLSMSRAVSSVRAISVLGIAAAHLVSFRCEAADVASKLPPATGRPVDFAKEIKPILEKSCLECHGPEKAKGKFLLDTREHALKGGDNGVDIFPGESAKSPLIHFVARAIEDSEMPPPGKGDPLTTEQTGLLRAWIDQGAAWPDSASVKIIDKRNHWAFKPPRRPSLPSVKQKDWVRNPIDAFILARLEKEKLKPSSAR